MRRLAVGLTITGGVLLATGVALVFVPAGLVVAGVLLLVAGWDLGNGVGS